MERLGSTGGPSPIGLLSDNDADRGRSRCACNISQIIVISRQNIVISDWTFDCEQVEQHRRGHFWISKFRGAEDRATLERSDLCSQHRRPRHGNGCSKSSVSHWPHTHTYTHYTHRPVGLSMHTLTISLLYPSLSVCLFVSLFLCPSRSLFFLSLIHTHSYTLYTLLHTHTYTPVYTHPHAHTRHLQKQLYDHTLTYRYKLIKQCRLMLAVGPWYSETSGFNFLQSFLILRFWSPHAWSTLQCRSPRLTPCSAYGRSSMNNGIRLFNWSMTNAHNYI